METDKEVSIRQRVETDKEVSIRQRVETDKESGDRLGWSVLFRPAVFTVTFSGLTIGVCSVWQYENMRSAALQSKLFSGLGGFIRQQKAGQLREMASQWWDQLSEGHKLFWPLAGLNLLVWCSWRVPTLQPVMMKWFMCNPAGRATCLPLLLSTFSHHSLIHLGVNMFVLHSLAPHMVHFLGKEQFLAVYLIGGVTSSLASSAVKVARGTMTFSLGASGAIMTALGMLGTLTPDSRMHIVLLPMLTFSAGTAIKCLGLVDLTGLLAGWKVFDHAAHLAGLLVGVIWCYQGNKLIWQNREEIVTVWHNFRDKNRRE